MRSLTECKFGINLSIWEQGMQWSKLYVPLATMINLLTSYTFKVNYTYSLNIMLYI